MTKARIILLGLLAALALSAVATATASAHEYFVEGKAITTNVAGTLASGTSVLSSTLLKEKIQIVSTLDTGTFTIGPSGTSTFSVTLSGLSLFKVNSEGHLELLSKCTVSPISFKGTDQLLESSSQWLDTFSGSAPPLLTEISITGSECALKKNKIAVDGTANAILPEVEVQNALHILEFTPGHTGSQSLTFGSEPATFESKESLVLNSGQTWGGSAAPSSAEFKLAEGHESGELKEEPTVNSPLVLEAEKEPTIECSKMKIKKGVVKNDSPEATIQSIHFESCVDKSEASCEVPTIATVELKDTLQPDGPKGDTDEKFAPKGGTGEEPEIASFTLKNKGSETCNETNELELAGDFISKQEDNEGSEDIHNLGIAVSPESKELKYGDQLRAAAFYINYAWGFTFAWFLF